MNFRMECSKMKKIGSTMRKLSNGGHVARQEKTFCQYCGNHTLAYIGTGIDCGEIYLAAVVKYCPRPGCGKMTVLNPAYDLYAEQPDKYLPVLCKKLRSGIYDDKVSSGSECPICGEKCFIYTRNSDIGCIGVWKVCSTTDCEYPGEFTPGAEMATVSATDDDNMQI